MHQIIRGEGANNINDNDNDVNEKSTNSSEKT